MKKLPVLLMLVMAMTFAAPAFADCGHCDKDKQCSTDKKCSREKSDDGGCQCPIAAKVMKKAHFFLENSDAIGLSDDQVAQIKAIKMETKRASVRQGAEMQVFEMDLKEKLSAPVLDVEGLNAMIDQASAGFATGAKASVANYVKLKAVLSEDQMKKAKEIWKKSGK